MKKLMAFIFAFGAAASFAYAADPECLAQCEADRAACLQVQGPAACNRGYNFCVNDCNAL